MKTEQDVRDALGRLEQACDTILDGETDSDDSARTILAGIRCAQEHLATVEASAVLEKRWGKIVESINKSIAYIRGERYEFVYEAFEVDDFLVRIQNLPSRNPGAQQRISADVVRQIRGDTESIKQKLEGLRTAHEHEIAELKRQAKAAADSLSATQRYAEQYQSSADAAEKRRSEAFDQQLARHQKSITGLESAAHERLEKELTRQRETFEQLATNVQNENSKSADEALQKSNSVLETLEAHLAQAEKILGVVSKTALAGSYTEAAERERKDANRWRWISVAAMVGIIACAILGLIHSFSTSFSTTGFTARIVTSFAFMILAAYAGRESARHRRAERHARRMQLELATIDSYLLSLPDEQRHAIKAAVAGRIFGQPLDGGAPEGVEGAHPSLLEYLKLALPDGK